MSMYHAPRPRANTLIYLNADANAGDLARTLFRELGEVSYAHLKRAMAELGERKSSAVLVAEAEFANVWRAR